MKILITVELEDRLVEAIRAVSDEVEVLCASGEEALSIIPEVEVVCGGIGQEMFLKAEKLRWVQSWSAGVDEMLFPELVASEVVLTSAKGTVGVHLAEHAMGFALGANAGDQSGCPKAELGPAVSDSLYILGTARPDHGHRRTWGDGERAGEKGRRLWHAHCHRRSGGGGSATRSGGLLEDGSFQRPPG